jgi:hypothetical protein
MTTIDELIGLATGCLKTNYEDFLGNQSSDLFRVAWRSVKTTRNCCATILMYFHGRKPHS